MFVSGLMLIVVHIVCEVHPCVERLPNPRWNNLELQQCSIRVIPHVTVCKMDKIGDHMLHK